MLELTIDSKQILAIKNALDKLPPTKQGSALVAGFADAGNILEKALKDNCSNMLLRVRSGRLRSSIGSRISNVEGDLTLEVGSGVRQGNRVKYADIQETGGTVNAKPGGWLTIPTEYAQTAAGVTRFTARQLFNAPTSFGFDGAVILQHIIFGYIGMKTRDKLIPLFILKKSVTIPGAGYLSKTLAENMQNIFDAINNRIEKALQS